MAGRDLSIIIPVYNEAPNVVPLIDRIAASLDGEDWEVLFVDDSSPDGTSEVVYAASLRDDRVRLILRVRDRGLSQACLQGLLSAKADILCVMDGDGQHDPGIIRKLVAPLTNDTADVVSAARHLDSARTEGALSARRAFMSRCGNMLSRLLLGRDIHDPLTGFFAIRRSEFVKVAPRLTDSGFKILLDILASERRLRHLEVPFTFGARAHGQSKLDLATMWEFGSFLVSKLTGSLVPPRLVSFVLVGGTGVVVHFSALYAFLALGSSFGGAQAGGASLAVVSNYLLNNRLTFRDRRLRGPRLVLGLFYFMLISSVGLIANVAMASYAYGELQGMAIPAALAGIAIDTVWKFAVSSRMVWARR